MFEEQIIYFCQPWNVRFEKKRAYLAVLKAFMYERKDELSWVSCFNIHLCYLQSQSLH